LAQSFSLDFFKIELYIAGFALNLFAKIVGIRRFCLIAENVEYFRTFCRLYKAIAAIRLNTQLYIFTCGDILYRELLLNLPT
jgi:hypothetical protein